KHLEGIPKVGAKTARKAVIDFWVHTRSGRSPQAFLLPPAMKSKSREQANFFSDEDVTDALERYVQRYRNIWLSLASFLTGHHVSPSDFDDHDLIPLISHVPDRVDAIGISYRNVVTLERIRLNSLTTLAAFYRSPKTSPLVERLVS